MTLIRFIVACIRRLIHLLKNGDKCILKDEPNNSSNEQIARLSTLDGYTIIDSSGNIITIKE